MADLNLDEIKEKVIELTNDAGDKAKNIAAAVGDKARRIARIAKLNGEITAENAKIREAYEKIGETYYRVHGENPEAIMSVLCASVDVAEKTIALKKSEIRQLHVESEAAGVSMDADFESVVESVEKANENAVEDVAEEDAEENGGSNDGEQ